MIVSRQETVSTAADNYKHMAAGAKFVSKKFSYKF
jgi:hypothetical protein